MWANGSRWGSKRVWYCKAFLYLYFQEWGQMFCLHLLPLNSVEALSSFKGFSNWIMLDFCQVGLKLDKGSRLYYSWVVCICLTEVTAITHNKIPHDMFQVWGNLWAPHFLLVVGFGPFRPAHIKVNLAGAIYHHSSWIWIFVTDRQIHIWQTDRYLEELPVLVVGWRLAIPP